MNDNINAQKVAVLTQRVDTIDITLKSMASDVREIRDVLAENRGIVRAVRWASHSFMALAGLVAGYFGATHK